MKTDIDPSAQKLVMAMTKHWLKEHTGFIDTVLSAVAEEVAPLIAAQVQMYLASQMSADGHRIRYDAMLSHLREGVEYIDETRHTERRHMAREFVDGLRWRLECGVAIGEGKPLPEKPKTAAAEGDIPF